MAQKTKLELTWIGKDNRSKLEPRILVENPAKSYHAPLRVTGNDIFDRPWTHVLIQHDAVATGGPDRCWSGLT